eukprot:TRINITY_DN11818_c0_g1_i1.p1 TRINITY_DN11818_c0_g1~~TRINITY_DN11818_c0_g1_i1.p1  ORF type:complete len:115 (-),score=50.52 TRINITY_DN11818_c0_g1_i1:78-422(-)
MCIRDRVSTQSTGKVFEKQNRMQSRTGAGVGKGPKGGGGSAGGAPSGGGAAKPARKSGGAVMPRSASSSSGGGILRFYTEDSPGLQVGPTVVLGMSLAFIGFVILLHLWGKLNR